MVKLVRKEPSKKTASELLGRGQNAKSSKSSRELLGGVPKSAKTAKELLGGSRGKRKS